MVDDDEHCCCCNGQVAINVIKISMIIAGIMIIIAVLGEFLLLFYCRIVDIVRIINRS